MAILIWAGASLSLLGLVGIVWSLIRVIKLRRQSLDDQELRDGLMRTLPLNLGAFFVSILGLLCVVFGVVLS